jgi:hypothetical protein
LSSLAVDTFSACLRNQRATEAVELPEQEIARLRSPLEELPGLARFLLPSTLCELQHAAGVGPVVIVNASQYTCDAFVIFFNRYSVHIPLQITKSRVQDLSSELQSLTLDAKLMDIGRHFARFLRVL